MRNEMRNELCKWTAPFMKRSLRILIIEPSSLQRMLFEWERELDADNKFKVIIN